MPELLSAPLREVVNTAPTQKEEVLQSAKNLVGRRVMEVRRRQIRLRKNLVAAYADEIELERTLAYLNDQLRKKMNP